MNGLSWPWAAGLAIAFLSTCCSVGTEDLSHGIRGIGVGRKKSAGFTRVGRHEEGGRWEEEGQIMGSCRSLGHIRLKALTLPKRVQGELPVGSVIAGSMRLRGGAQVCFCMQIF